MFGEVKNPFGLRNGIHITVNDLSENERGLACNCVCPLCKDPFEARLGNIRIHHFAHSGEGCDEIASYLMGLYGFFRDFILSHECTLPELIIYYHVDRRRYVPVTADNDKDQICFYPTSDEDIRSITLKEEVRIRFESAEIVLAKNGRPEAVVAAFHGKSVAFVIAPPDTVCKDFMAKPYKEMATLEILLYDKADIISRANTEKMNGIFSDSENFLWLSSPMVSSAFDRINKEREEAYRAYQIELEKIRVQQEEARKRQEEQKRKEQEKRQQELEQQQKELKKQEEERKIKEAKREEEDKRLVEEQIKVPNQLVVDSHGRRWIKCKICGKVATADNFWTYQWNRGECNECGRKTNQTESSPIPMRENPPMEPSAAKEPGTCPWCGSKLVRKNGKNGAFIGCSSFPRCRYSRSL